MNNGLYAAYLGMRARQQTLDRIANNIANASTAGFKADRSLYQSIEAASGSQINADTQDATPTEAGASAANQPTANGAGQAQVANAPTQVSNAPKATSTSTHGVSVGVVASGATDFSGGSIRETGRALDVALAGDGFLVVQTARGERYTRSGALTLDSAGQLVTQSGDLVVGEGGPITVPPGEVSIGEDGTVSAGGREAGRLRLVRFADPQFALAKEGGTLFAQTGAGRASEAVGTRVIGGALEGSNADAVGEMVAMMQNSREFDSLQRCVTLLMNDIGKKISNDIGRI